MIDLGRKKDMEALMNRVNDESIPLSLRRGSYRSFMSIRRKMNDPVITKLRLRLIAATVGNDLPEVLKIGERLTEYEARHYGKRKF